MTVKEEIRQIVELLDDERATEALKYLRRLWEGDLPTIDGTEDADEGRFWKLGRPTSADDPLWELVGIIGEEYDVPVDLSSNHDKYLSGAYADLHDK